MSRFEEIDWAEADDTAADRAMDRLNAESAARRAAGRKKWHRS